MTRYFATAKRKSTATCTLSAPAPWALSARTPSALHSSALWDNGDSHLFLFLRRGLTVVHSRGMLWPCHALPALSSPAWPTT